MSRAFTPVALGGNTTSVERLLESRTAAESACDAVTTFMSGAFRRDDLTVAVTGVSGGARDIGEDRLLDLRSESGTIGHLLLAPASVVSLADLIMGGTGVAEEREPTPVEIELVLGRLTGALRPLLSAVTPGRGQLVRIEPVERRAVGRAMSILLEIRLADHVMALTVEILDRQILGDADRDQMLMRSACEDVGVDLRVFLEPMTMRTADLATLQPGDVLCFEHEASEPLTCVVDGREVFRARIGRHRRQAAIQVVDVIEGEN